MNLLYTKENRHGNNFDFVRVLLATLVVFCHSYPIYYGNLDKEPFWILSKHQVSVGTCAINFFFIISGFLVSQSWDQSKGYSSFFAKRLLRVYPAFLVACGVCALIVAPLGLNDLAAVPAYLHKMGMRYVLLTALKLQGVAVADTFTTLPIANTVNASLWSIPYEVACYFAIPLCALMGVFRHPVRAVLVVLLVLAINVLHFEAYSQYSTNNVFRYDLIPYFPKRYFEELIGMEHLLLPFVAGSAFYACRHYIPRSAYLAVFSSVCLVIATRWVPCFEIAQSFFGAYLLFYFMFNKGVTFHHFAKYGDFSYGIYLYGWPFQQLILLYFGHQVNVFGLFFGVMVVVLPVAALSWHLVEKPFLRVKHKLPAWKPAANTIGLSRHSH